MKKRSAMTIAAGLVFALMVGAAAVAMGATGPDPAGGSEEVRSAQPHVRTITRTVEVQRATGDLAAPGTVQGSAPANTIPLQGSSDDGWDDDEGWEDDRWDDGGDDDHGGGDDHGDDADHGDDDHGDDD